MVRHAKLHRGRDPQGFMNPAEVVVGGIERDRRDVVFKLCQRRSKNASVGRSKNASDGVAQRAPAGALCAGRIQAGLLALD